MADAADPRLQLVHSVTVPEVADDGDLFETPLTPIEPDLLYEILAARIRGKACGWAPSALARLEAALLARFADDLGPDARPLVARLVVLARNPAAA